MTTFIMNPLYATKMHGFAMRSMSLRDMQIPKSEKKILSPPLPNPGDAPEICEVYIIITIYYNIYDTKLISSLYGCFPIENTKLIT